MSQADESKNAMASSGQNDEQESSSRSKRQTSKSRSNNRTKSKGKSKSKSRKHRRKLSNASIMSIDPYTLVQLKQTYQNQQFQNGLSNNNDPTSNSGQYNNDINRAWNQVSNNNNNLNDPNGMNNNNVNNNNNNLNAKQAAIDAEKMRIWREMAEELQPALDEAKREYRELWEEKELIELEVDQVRKETEIIKQQYEAKIDELNKQIYEIASNKEIDTEMQLNENDRMLKEEFSAKIEFMEQDYQKAINNYDIQLKRKNNELENAYTEVSTLRESIDFLTRENNQLQKTINESNKLNQKYRMLQRKYDESMKESNELRSEIYKLHAENEELIQHNTYLQEMLDQQRTEQNNRGLSATSFDTELITAVNNESPNNKRGSVDMDKNSNRSSLHAPFHRKGQASINVGDLDLAAQLNNPENNNNNNNDAEASEEQKVIDKKDKETSLPHGAQSNNSSSASDTHSYSGSHASDTSNKQEKGNDRQSNTNTTNNKANDPAAPTSWQQVQAGLDRKESTLRKVGSRGASSQQKKPSAQSHSQKISTIDEFSMISQYSDSETNVGDRLDDMNGDIKEMKEMLQQILNNNNNGIGVSNELKQNLAPVYRAIRQIQIMIGRDFDPNFNLTHQRSATSYNHNQNNSLDSEDYNQSTSSINAAGLTHHRGNNILTGHHRDHSDRDSNTHSNDDSHEDGSGMSGYGSVGSWMSWLFGDLGDSRINSSKRSLIREYGPPLAFSSVIIAAAYLIIVYQRGYNVLGQPKVNVLRKK